MESSGLIVSDVQIRERNFSSSILTDANLKQTTLTKMDLSNVELKFPSAEELVVMLTNARGMGVHSGEFINSIFEYTDFRRAFVSGVTFEGCKFRGCMFVSTTIKGCKFINCEFTDCIFSDAILVYCDLTASIFTKCNFDDAEMIGFMPEHMHECSKNGRPIQKLITVHGMDYPIEFFEGHFKFACAVKPMDTFIHMSDRDLLALDGRRALRFHRKYKDWVVFLAQGEGLYETT